MRTTRALFAGLGTTGSLVAAAGGVFLVASAVIAFNSWPGAGFTDRIDNLFVKDSPSVAWDKPGTQAVASAAGAGSAAVAGTAAGPTFGTPGVVLGGNGAAQRGGTVRLPGGALVSTGVNGPGTVGTTNPSNGTGPVGLPQVQLPQVGNGQTQNTVADTVQQTGSGVGNTVRQTTDTVGNAVGGPVGDTVKQTGNGVGQTVDNVTNTVGGLLRPKQ
jgi:hypothetical protein